MTADIGDGKSQAGQLGNPGLPVMYPKLIVSGLYAGYCFSLNGNCNDPSEPAVEYAHSYPRRYVIRDRAGKRHAAYVMTLLINAALGQYYTVQGTTWRDPPIFNSPKRIQVVAGRKLYEYLDGSKIALVAYKTPNGVYWISNTLANDIPNHEMIAMAVSLTIGLSGRSCGRLGPPTSLPSAPHGCGARTDRGDRNRIRRPRDRRGLRRAWQRGVVRRHRRRQDRAR